MIRPDRDGEGYRVSGKICGNDRFSGCAGSSAHFFSPNQIERSFQTEQVPTNRTFQPFVPGFNTPAMLLPICRRETSAASRCQNPLTRCPFTNDTLEHNPRCGPTTRCGQPATREAAPSGQRGTN